MPIQRLGPSKEEGASLQTPVVETKADRLNPEVEYDVLDLVSLAPEALKTRLNELGQEGWMLVSTSPSFIFRRLKKSEEGKTKARVGFSVG